MRIQHVIFLLAITMSFLSSMLWSQCPSNSYSSLQANQVNAQINNSAELFWDLNGEAKYEVPKGSGKSVSFASSLWIGGLDPQGGLHVAASTYRQSGTEFYAGPFRSGTPYNCGKSYDTPSVCFSDGGLWLSSGKILNVYNQGFQVYDPQMQTATQHTLPASFQNAKAMELPNGNVLFLGWQTSNIVPSEVVLVDSSSFAVLSNDTLNDYQRYASMVLLPTGKVLIMGPAGVEEYDPQSHLSLSKASTAYIHQRASALLLPSGLVLLAGGGAAAIELYDPAQNTWQTGPSVSVARQQFPQLTLLSTGEVLISGGNPTVPTTELYLPSSNIVVVGTDLPEAVAEHQVYVIGPDELLIVAEHTGGPSSGPFIFHPSSGLAHRIPLQGSTTPSCFRNGIVALGYGQSDHFVFVDLATESLVGARWQHVWNVTRAQVDLFLVDFANQSINVTQYPDILTWPGNGNTFAGEDAQLAPYIDVDQDGVYDPINDGDYPCFPGDQGLWWVFNDDGVHGESQGTGFPVQVEALAYSFDCDHYPCPDSSLDYTTFYHYEITNKASQDYRDVRIGYFEDADLGNWSDDYVGCDTALGLGFAYNGDANDEGASGYGLNPPAFGSLVLPNGQIDAMTGFHYYQNDFSVTGNPELAFDFYQYLRGFWKDGSPVVDNGGDGYLGTLTGPPTNYMFPGDPGWCGGAAQGWSEVSAGNQPFDRRYMQRFGPMDLAAGQSVNLDLALIYARSTNNGNLGSVCKLRNDATFVRNWWSGALNRECLSLEMHAPGTIAPASFAAKVVPNPSNGNFALVLDAPATEQLYVELLTLHGQTLLREVAARGTTTLQVAGEYLPKGMYLVRIVGSKSVSTLKVVLD